MIFNHKSLSGKIIFTFLIACIILLLSWGVTRITFRKIMEPVNRLSESSPQLTIVHYLFKEVVRLDQQQSLASPDPLQMLEQYRQIGVLLDSLETMSGEHPAQRARIDTMRLILDKRARLFIRYQHLRRDYIANDSLNERIRLLSEFIHNSPLRSDTALFNKESTISSTTIEHVDTLSKQSFWDRVFRRKKIPQKKEIQHMVLEQLNVSVDTLALMQEDSMIQQLSQSIARVEDGRKKQLNTLNRQRITLDSAGNILVDQLLATLNDMEQAELRETANNNRQARDIINGGLESINIILIVFVLFILLLAVMILSDIAKSNRYKKELILAKEEAERLGQIKQRFLANMSHELRTPLQAIIGYAEQMKEDETQRSGENIGIVYQSSLHLLHIVNEILDYSRIISGKLVIESRLFSLKEVLDNVYRVIAIQAETKGLYFEQKIPETLAGAHYWGDPFRLKQILFNLLHNAVKFTPSGGITLSMSLKSYKKHDTLTFTIQDTGIGIPAEHLSAIFKPFEQLETMEMQAGSGLGLSIVQSLVESQSGTIAVESIENTGTTFTVNLPYTRAKALQQVSAEAFVITGSETRTQEVWIVDDDPVILQLCDRILENHRIPHRSFSSAQSLLDTPIPDTLSAILMDIRMPVIDGFQLLNQLGSRLPDKQEIRLVALTAQALPEEKEAILQKGFHVLLRKPFLASELLQVLGLQDSPAVHHLEMVDDRDVWDTFFKETDTDLQTLNRLLKQQDFEAITELLHRIAGRLGQLGFTTLSKGARSLEIRLRGGTIDETSIQAMLHELQSFLDQQKR